MGVRRNSSRGQRRHFVHHFQIADDQCSLKDNFYTEQTFVLVSMIILGLSKWSFQWITNFVNYVLNIQSYQNTNRTHISFTYLLVFGGVSIALECCKRARMRFHCATVLADLSICAPYREHCWRCNANGGSENALSFLRYKENVPCYGSNHKKRLIGSNSQVYRDYDNLHSAQSADFQRRAFVFK